MFYYNHNGEIYKVTKELYEPSIIVKLENYKTEIICTITSITVIGDLITMSDLYSSIDEKNMKLSNELSIDVLVTIGKNTRTLTFSYPVIINVKPEKIFSELDYKNIDPIEYYFKDVYKNLSIEEIMKKTIDIKLPNMNYVWYRFNIIVKFIFKSYGTGYEKNNKIILKLTSGDKYKIINPIFDFKKGNYNYYNCSKEIDNIWLPISNDIKIEIIKITCELRFSDITISVDAAI